MYKVDDPIGVTAAGSKLYVASVGNPFAESVTFCKVPEINSIFIAIDPELDTGSVRLLGVTEISKSNLSAEEVGVRVWRFFLSYIIHELTKINTCLEG